MMKRLVVIFTSLVPVILLTLFYQLRFVSITGFIPSLKLSLHQRSSQHTYGQHPTLNERCYKYHKNLTAENTCCKMVNFSGFVGLIHKCIRNANDQLLRDKRFHTSEGADEGGGVVDVTEGGGGTEPTRGQHWVIFGDSHMRYILVSFLTRLRSPSLEYRIPVDDKGWKSVAPAEERLHNDKPFKNIEVRDLSINLNITFFWDVHLKKHLPQEINKWEQQPHHTPSLVLLGSALWWMKDNEAIYVKFGAKTAADLYEHYLRSLRDRLSHLAKTTTVIFKLVDDVPRTRNPKSKTAFGVRSNFVLYNQLAVQLLGNTGVIIWNSTVPLSLDYTKECTKHFRDTPPWYQWKCKDQGHVGYILVYQYVDMVLNDFCGKYLNLGHEFCT